MIYVMIDGRKIMPYMELCYSDDKWVHIPISPIEPILLVHSKTLCGKIGKDYHLSGSQGKFHTKDECCPICWELYTGRKKETENKFNFVKKTKCRIKVTLACNLKCEYCINKLEEYSKKWIPLQDFNGKIFNLDGKEVDLKKYRTIIVSGGEPLLYPKLVAILCCLRRKAAKDTPIYLQTNGIFLTKNFVKMVDGYIDGIGISVHSWNTFIHLRTRYVDIMKIKPIRLYIQNTETNKMIYDEMKLNWCFPDVRWWDDGKFDENEEIFVINN
jgi:hypothetical protein